MSTKTNSSFIVAAPRSNSGKTLVTLGLIKALTNRGLNVQPFKCGPDYIDTMHHTKASGNTSYNLDSWMSSKNHITEVFNSRSTNKDISIIEGVMGLYDGAKKDIGSTAELARHLNIPIVLVVDASSMAYSVAPLLFGYKNFDKQIHLAGVIFNKVGSESHYKILKEAAEDVGIQSLGFLLKDKKLLIESRHLGLHLPEETNTSELIENTVCQIDANIDLDLLLSSCKKEIPESKTSTTKQNKPLNVAVAHDEAFNFTYPANINALESIANVKTFSPLKDQTIPECDLVWLPGGYPELHAEKLSGNTSMLESIKKHIDTGKALIAECGGMMYLGQAITDKEGTKHPMGKIFNYSTSMENGKLHLGYRKVMVEGTEIRGHEFHYSELIHVNNTTEYLIKGASDQVVNMPVFRFKNCWASYMHTYLGEPENLKAFLKHLSISLNS